MWSESAADNDERVLVLPPTRRDGDVTRELLARADIACVVCPDLDSVVAGLADGVGAVVLTEAALLHPRMACVLAVLAQQPAWSDIPTLVLAGDRQQSPALLHMLDRLSNVTLLDRPTSTRALLSAVAAALRGRRRQYQIRDQLAQQRQAEEALRDADKRKDEFLATLAHELRNPLAPIRTGLQLLPKLQGAGAQPSRVVEMMQRQVTQLVKLIDDLLDVSRIATGKVALQRERFDLREAVDAALEISAPAVASAGHQVDIDLPQEPVPVSGDRHRLAQVISNLLNNAAKYTPNGGQITVRLVDADGHATVSVTDNGVGIPPDMLGQVFDMFAQVDRTLDRAQGGLGIGLALVRRLMDLHGGSVGAHSAGLGSGSTFFVRLPVLDEQARPAAATTVSGLPTRRSTPALRILVIDDNTDAADLLSALLSASGHTVRTEQNGADGLAAAAAFAPEVVICDIRMAGMDGHGVAMRLRADPRHAGTLLVAVTGWGSEADKRRTQAAGFDHHLTKPVNYETLAELLAGLTARQSQSHRLRNQRGTGS